MKSTIKWGLIATLIGVVLSAIMAAFAAHAIVDGQQYPVHWGPHGADRFADGAQARNYVWVMPGIALFLGGLLTVCALIEPLKDNLIKSRRAYLSIWIATTALLVFIQAGLTSGATGLIDPGFNFARIVIAAAAAIFILLGNYLPKTRANFFLGVRTPWTLTSDTSWEKTHRLCGRLFILIGIIGFIGAFILNGIALGVMLPAMAIPTVLVLIVYSYFAWRGANDHKFSSDYLV